jgi:hypothetical protein
MDTDLAGDRGAAGSAVGQVELKLHDAWDCLLDFTLATWLGLLDRVSPPPETPVDPAIREEGERLRKAFPWLAFLAPTLAEMSLIAGQDRPSDGLRKGLISRRRRFRDR